MADKKISALTAATTPLDGTEVLPIVQSGSTVKVANNDLRPKQIQSNATSGVLQVAGPASAATRVMTTPDANFTAARTDAAQTFTGNQTITGSVGWSALALGNVYANSTGQPDVPNTTPTVLFTGVNPGVYNFIAYQVDDPGNRTAAAIVVLSTPSTIKTYVAGTDWSLSLSGNDVVLTNTSGFTRGCRWTAQRMR